MILPAISAGLGLASSIYGGIKSAQDNKEFENQINQQESQAEAFFNNRVNRDFMETNAAKSVVEQLRKQYLDQAKKIDSQTAATGGTAEANIAAKGNLNENYNNVMSDVAGQATGYQENAENQYQGQISDIAKQRMMLAEKKNENAMNLVAGGASLLGTAADLGALEDVSAVNQPNQPASVTGISPTNRTALNNIAKSAVIPKADITGLTDYKTKTNNRIGENFFDEQLMDTLNRGKV